MKSSIAMNADMIISFLISTSKMLWIVVVASKHTT